MPKYDAEERISKLREGLKYIAGQGCEADIGDYERCEELQPLHDSEYCTPCYAAHVLEQDDAIFKSAIHQIQSQTKSEKE